MAVDTRDKRASCLLVDLHYGRVWPNADASLANAADRTHMTYKYAFGAASPPPVTGNFFIMFV